MAIYQIAAMRGKDFEIKANSPEDAWKKLVEQEKDNGNLWKTSCPYCNKTAILEFGFTAYNPKDLTQGAYKLLNTD